jgi:predicted dehydrogenase
MIRHSEERTVTASAPTVGIIGLSFGRAHIPAFQAHGCRVIAVSQRDRAAAKTVAERYAIPDVFERWEDLLERAHPDIVVVATPPHLHRAICERAFATGAHVLCEKPLAMTAVEARAMMEAAARAGRVAMTSFNWRFSAAAQEMRARVVGGVLGRVFHVGARWFGGSWALASTTPTWRMDRAQAGHGAMGDMGVHLVDLVRANFGEFARVNAHTGIAYPERAAPGGARPADAEDYGTVLVELTSGAHVTLAVSRAAFGRNEHTIEAYGTQGALSYRLLREGERWWEGELSLSEGAAGFTRVPVPATPAVVGEGAPLEVVGKATIAPLVARLLDGIRTGQTPSPSFEDGARAQAVLDAVLASARDRRWVDVARD